ncbi:hypothetical protein RRG08_054878 [Elysia crispata]|uniref:Uncharacterized protein n=1 Tax=Elysia crispata TaxID=231223 RepID=A0AAE1A572_9GAST|nr:hypothetical protein RRG08_054878 [Elysia crispata]
MLNAAPLTPRANAREGQNTTSGDERDLALGIRLSADPASLQSADCWDKIVPSTCQSPLGPWQRVTYCSPPDSLGLRAFRSNTLAARRRTVLSADGDRNICCVQLRSLSTFIFGESSQHGVWLYHTYYLRDPILFSSPRPAQALDFCKLGTQSPGPIEFLPRGSRHSTARWGFAELRRQAGQVGARDPCGSCQPNTRGLFSRRVKPGLT